MSSRRSSHSRPRTFSRLFCPSSSLPLTVLAAGLVSLASCNFLSPSVISFNLAKDATATCTGSCTPSGNDTVTCTDAKVCTLACPARTGFPARQNPLMEWTPPIQGPGCLSNATPSNLPAVANISNGFLEVTSSKGPTAGCVFSKTSPPTTSGHRAVSMWIKPTQCSGNCTLVQVGNSNGVLLKLHNNTVCLDSICGSTLPLGLWTLIVLQVPGGSGWASVVINSTTSTSRLINMPVSVSVDIAVGVLSGTSLSPNDSYLLADVRHYNDLLTEREIEMLSTGILLNAGLFSECRCPSTHLQLKRGDTYTCVNNGSDETRRLKINYHSPSVLVDDNSTTQWMGPDAGDVILNISMGVTYQVDSFAIQFLNTTPASIQLEFGGTRNVTCSATVCNFTLQPLNTSASPTDLRARVASSLTVRLIQPGRNIIIRSLTVLGRCNCNGNAETCNTSGQPYGCNCKPETNSEGRQCERCSSNKFRPQALFSCSETCNCEVSNTVNVTQICDMDGGACRCKANVANVQDSRCTSCKNWTYGLSAAESLGCLPCMCHQNGSKSCDKVTGNCQCKDNVKAPHCDSCMDNHYDNGPDEGPDVCLPCNCNSAGTKMNTMCNNATGQCDCKNFVQGRRCDECKDRYYSLQEVQPYGCLDCSCNPIGSTSWVCNKTSGQCPCLGDLLVNKTCTPWLEKMEPIFGPMAGGTVVTLTGHLLGNSSQKPMVYFGSVMQDFINHTESMIIFQTKPGSESLSVKVSWDDFSDAFDLPNKNFTYRSDPELDQTSVPAEVAMFVSGGCGISFKGKSFDSVATPYIIVTSSTGKSVRARCRHIAADLRCATPDVGELHDPLNSRLHFGLELDGITMYRNLGNVTVKRNPSLLPVGDLDFQYPFEKTITLKGSGLLESCSRDEISVLIGVTGCSIQSLSDSEIKCQPPTSPPGGIKKHQLTVKIGSNIEMNLGMLVYVDVWKTSIFIGIMCGIGALILLIIIIIILYCCRSRRKRSMSNGNSQINLVNKDGKTDTPQNQYTTLPLEQLNNGPREGEDTYITPVAVVRQPRDALPPTASEVDLMTEFLNRLEPSLWDGVKSSIISSNDLKPGRICTARGKYARIIDGTFTTVTAGQKTEKKVTIKTLKEPLPETGVLPSWAGEALRECLRLYRHSDDNVLSLIGLALDKQKFHMVYPFMQNRTLKDHIIDTEKEFSVRQLVEFGLQVAEGLNYLVTKDITHRDLATRNCMVDGHQELKITDAAFSWDFYENEYVYDSVRERYMPIRWMAPESLTDGFYDMRSDVWSFGVLLWELLTRGCLPFHEVKDPLVKEYVLEGYMLGKPQNCSEKLYELMRQCWDPENEHRPHISAVVTSLSAELTGGGVDQEDIYVNLGTVEGFYENQMALGNKSRRRAPPPPRASQI